MALVEERAGAAGLELDAQRRNAVGRRPDAQHVSGCPGGLQGVAGKGGRVRRGEGACAHRVDGRGGSAQSLHPGGQAGEQAVDQAAEGAAEDAVARRRIPVPCLPLSYAHVGYDGRLGNRAELACLGMPGCGSSGLAAHGKGGAGEVRTAEQGTCGERQGGCSREGAEVSHGRLLWGGRCLAREGTLAGWAQGVKGQEGPARRARPGSGRAGP